MRSCRPGARLISKVLIVVAFQLACTVDLPPLPRQGEAPSTVVAAPVHTRLRTSRESAAVLFTRVRPTVDVEPTDCGQHFVRRTSDGLFGSAGVSDLELSLKCGMAAARAKQPFWTFAQLQGIDSWFAEGLVGGSDGLIRHFSYDSSPSGNLADDSRFRLDMSACARPPVRIRNGYATFACADRK